LKDQYSPIGVCFNSNLDSDDNSLTLTYFKDKELSPPLKLIISDLRIRNLKDITCEMGHDQKTLDCLVSTFGDLIGKI